MKITRYLVMLSAALGLFSACQKLDELRAYDPSQVVPPVLDALPAEIVINDDTKDQTQIFSWDAADFGVRTPVSYTVVAVYDDNEITLVSGLNNTTSWEPTYDQLNNRLAAEPKYGGLGLPIETPSEVFFHVTATIGSNFEVFLSNTVSTIVTAMSTEVVFPKVWVIGKYCDWNHGKSQFLFQFNSSTDNYEAIVDFGELAKEGFKITGEAGWNDGNWGLDGDQPKPDPEAASVQLIDSGGSKNIDVYSKRFYRFRLDRATLKLENTLSFDKLGIIGEAIGGWGDNDEVFFNFDPLKQRFWVDVDFAAGPMKFRADAGWDLNWGSSGAEGGLRQGGGNITVSAGPVRVYVNLNNSADMTYELNAADYGEDVGPPPVRADWYIHGQINASEDWSEAEMEIGKNVPLAYKVTGIEVLANSQFLFKNGEETKWLGADKGFAAGANPFLCVIGDAFDISEDKVNVRIVDAGTYDFWFLPDEGRAYIMPEGEMPDELKGDTWGLVGTINSWGDEPDLVMTASGQFFVRTGVALTTTDKFKIRANGEWNNAKNYGLTAEVVIDPNIGIPLITGGGSKDIMVSAAGTYDIYFDLGNSMLYIMAEGTKPVAWGLVGTINNWGAQPDLGMTPDGNYFVRKGVALTTASEFKFRANNAWNDAYNVGPPADGVISVNTRVTGVNGNGAKNIKVNMAGTYDVYLDFTGLKFYVLDEGTTPADIP